MSESQYHVCYEHCASCSKMFQPQFMSTPNTRWHSFKSHKTHNNITQLWHDILQHTQHKLLPMCGIERLTSSLSTNSLFYALLVYCKLEYHML